MHYLRWKHFLSFANSYPLGACNFVNNAMQKEIFLLSDRLIQDSTLEYLYLLHIEEYSSVTILAKYSTYKAGHYYL